MNENFNIWKVPELKQYLRSRGITVTGYNKLQLLRLAEVASEIGLPSDVNLANCATIKEKLATLCLPFEDPFVAPGFSDKFADIPSFSLYDIFNFLICKRTDYDRKKLKAYKSFDDYKLFNDGHVERLSFNPLPENDRFCMFKSSVRPTQRDQTYLKSPYYDLWIIMGKETGEVSMAYCQCPGGADGACRHIAATLFEIEDYEPKSCTDGENRWMKRPRTHDEPVPIRSLKIFKAKHKNISNEVVVTPKPYSDCFDPRHPDHRQGPTEHEINKFTENLKEINPKMQVLDILMEPQDEGEQACKDVFNSMSTDDYTHLTMIDKVREYASNKENINTNSQMCQDFVENLTCSEQDAAYIESKTQGQTENKMWYELRKGIITASNFQRVLTHVNSGRKASALLTNLIDGDVDMEGALPAPLQWGRKYESVAKELYKRSVGNIHKRLKIEEKGLCYSQKHPFVACSPDGLVKCCCKPTHNAWLIEVKCPYSLRLQNPKQAALEKGCEIVDGKLRLSVNSSYYSQIQGQLGITGYELCHLVVFTKLGIEVIDVTFDATFFENMISKLNAYFTTEMVPGLFKKACQQN